MNNRSILILILGLLSAIGPFSIDTYLSGFPTIAADLHVTVDAVSYSLSSFFIGVAFAGNCFMVLTVLGAKNH